MNSEPRKRKLSGLLESLEKRKKREINMWQDELNQCREALRKLKNADTKDMTPLQFAHYRNRLHLEVKKGVALTQKLKATGVQVEKRGRPKKEPSEAYKQTHVKFTAMLKPGNLDYLKRLKDSGSIDNISAFLDDLIERHRSGREGEETKKFNFADHLAP